MRNYTNTRATVFVGDRFTNRYGCEAEVIKYESAKKVTIRFLDDFGYELTTAVSTLRNINFKNPYYASVHGVGYLGKGAHRAKLKGKDTTVYQRWAGMIARCYASGPGYYETYIGCTVVPEWHNFQNFAEWHSKQPFIEGMQIDKDILKKNNRTYSLENCRLVPTEINKAMTGGKKNKESGLPTGVVHRQGRFMANITTSGKHRYLGTFDTPEEAFAVYKFEKELHIRELAEKYKDVLVPEIYQAMLVWEVLITD